MSEPQLLADPARIGRKLGIRGPLSADQRETIVDAIEDAQEAVEGHLNRAIFPVVETRHGVRPKPGHALTSWEAWFHLDFADVIEVRSAVPDAEGTYTLTVAVGLDAEAIPAIKRYVRAHATEDVRLNDASGIGKRRKTSLSAEGQSISFESGSASKGSAGALPELSSLDQWIRRSAYQANRPATAPWPMSGFPVGWDPR